MPRQNNRNRHTNVNDGGIWTFNEDQQAVPAERQIEALDAEYEELEREYRAYDLADVARDMEEQRQFDQVQREVDRIRTEELAAVRQRPLRADQLALNKTQPREIMAHSQVWERIPVSLRTRINNAVASEGQVVPPYPH